MPPPMYPKPKRIVDREAIESVRAFGKCMMLGMGECYGELDVHHIVGRGAGGNDTLDNLVLLCRGHHNLIHAKKITIEGVKSRRDFLKRIGKPLR